MAKQGRVPRGVSQGGQFAASAKGEAGVSLASEADEVTLSPSLVEQFEALCEDRGVNPENFPGMHEAWAEKVAAVATVPDGSSTAALYDTLDLGDGPRMAWVLDVDPYGDGDIVAAPLSKMLEPPSEPALLVYSELDPKRTCECGRRESAPACCDGQRAANLARHDHTKIGSGYGYSVPIGLDDARAAVDAHGDDPRPLSAVYDFINLTDPASPPWAAMEPNPEMVEAREQARQRAVAISQREASLLREHRVLVPSRPAWMGGGGHVDRGAEEVALDPLRARAVEFLDAAEAGDAEAVRTAGNGALTFMRSSLRSDDTFTWIPFTQKAKWDGEAAELSELEEWADANPTAPKSVLEGVEKQRQRLAPPSPEYIEANTADREAGLAAVRSLVTAIDEIDALRTERDEVRKLARLDDDEMGFPGPVEEFVGPTRSWRLNPGRNPW